MSQKVYFSENLSFRGNEVNVGIRCLFGECGLPRARSALAMTGNGDGEYGLPRLRSRLAMTEGETGAHGSASYTFSYR